MQKMGALLFDDEKKADMSFLSLLCTPITHALLGTQLLDGNLHLSLYAFFCASVVSVVAINYRGAAFQKEEEEVHC